MVGILCELSWNYNSNLLNAFDQLHFTRLFTWQ